MGNAVRGFIALILTLFLSACGGETPQPEVSSGSIILISVDTLRADHLPAYGATEVATPNLDALAADSIVFENAYAQVPLTLPSHVSMLTGRLPASTGVRNNLGYRFDGSIPSLPTMLGDVGYAKGAAVSAYVLRSETGLGDLFDHYDDEMERSDGAIAGEIQRAGDATVSASIEWLDAQPDDRVFLFVHLFEPHTPYAPPEPFASRYHPYDGEIATADAAVGRLIDHLKERDLYDDATIVFLSDHGEGLGDHGEKEHGIFLYREAIHVPLFLKLPGSERGGTRVGAPVGLLDVFPTIVDLAGLEGAGQVDGRSLLDPAIDSADRMIYSETMYPRIHLGWSDLASLIDGHHHYIEAPRPELYDIVADPGETTNVLSDERRVYAAMRDELDSYDRELSAPDAISSEEAAKLAALGYLGGGGATEGPLPDPKDRIGDLESFVHASESVREGEGEKAVPELEQIVRRNPQFADGWTVLAKAYEQAGRLEDAVEAYRKTIEVAPVLAPGTALSLAELYVRLGNWSEAAEHASLAMEAHPASASLAAARATIGMGRAAEAERVLSPALSDRATRHEAQVIQAQSLVSQRQLERALTLVARIEAESTEPVPGRAFTEGDILARMGRLGEARARFEREIETFPRNREAFIRLAAIHLLEGNAAASQRVMRSLLEANPGAGTRAMIREAYRDLGRPDLASAW